MPSSSSIYVFTPFKLDVEKHQLLYHDQEVELRPKAFEVLLYLLQHPHRLVTKDELFSKVWSGSVVSETTLSHCIEEIRSALHDDAHNPRYVKTIHRLGYKFIGRVSSPGVSEPAVVAAAKHQPVKALLLAPLHNRLFLTLGMLFLLSIIILCSIYALRPRAIDSLAVLPFLNLSAQPNQEYMADGLTEALIARLAGIKGLRVISRTSVMQYKEMKKPLPVIAQELGVDAVIEGSMDHDSSRVRVTVQLIQARKEAHIWANTYEQPLSDLWTLHDQLAQAIATAISDTLSLSRTAQSLTPVVPRAYEAYLKGRYFLEKRREESFLKALEFFQQSIQIQPQFAAPYAGMASCYNMLANYDMQPPPRVAPLAKAAANQALTLDENLAEAHAALGFTLMFYDWDWPRSDASLRRALERNPNSSESHHWLALLCMATGRFAEALQEIKKAQTLDPLSLIINTNEGWLYYYHRQYDQAMIRLNAALEMNPAFASALIKKAWVLQQTGEKKEAVAILEQVCVLLQNDLNARAWYGQALAVAGETEKAQQILRELVDPGQNKYVSPYLVASIYVVLGDHESAWNWLERAYEQHSGWLVWLNVDPKLEPLHADARFEQMVKRMGLRP